jgi:hypothetical protein
MAIVMFFFIIDEEATIESDIRKVRNLLQN